MLDAIHSRHSLVAWQIFFDTLWSDFDSRFKLILGNLKRHKDLLDLQAVTSEMQEASTTRKAHEQKLDDIALGIEAASTTRTAHETKLDNITLGIEAASTARTAHEAKLDNIAMGIEAASTARTAHEAKLDNIAMGIEAASTARTAHEAKLDNIVDTLGLEIQKAEAARKQVAAEYGKNEKTRLESQRRDVVHWIDGIDCEDEKANASFYRHPNTGLWLFRRQEFISWFNGVPGVLWLTGMPGCGLLPTLIMDNRSIIYS